MVVTICSEEGIKLGTLDGLILGTVVGNNVGVADGWELGDSVGIADVEGADDGLADGEVLRVGCSDG